MHECDGQERRFKQAMELWAKPVEFWSICFSRTMPNTSRDDICQSAWLRLIPQLMTWSLDASFNLLDKAWATIVVRNVFIDLFRKSRSMTKYESVPDLTDKEEMQALVESMASDDPSAEDHIAASDLLTTLSLFLTDSEVKLLDHLILGHTLTSFPAHYPDADWWCSWNEGSRRTQTARIRASLRHKTLKAMQSVGMVIPSYWRSS